MTNQQFEESLKFDKWILEQFGPLANQANSFTISGSKLVELAHAIRNKVLHEAIEALPALEPVELNEGEDSYGNTHFNHGVQMSENALTQLLTKE